MFYFFRQFLLIDFVVVLSWQRFMLIDSWTVPGDNEPPDDGIPIAAPIQVPLFL